MKRIPAIALSLPIFWVACAGTAPLPPKALALNEAGVAALAAGDLEAADARFSLALEYNPKFVDALTNQGLVELQRGNFERARQLLTRARRLNPDVAQPHHALGVLAERERRPDLASRELLRSPARRPRFLARSRQPGAPPVRRRAVRGSVAPIQALGRESHRT